MLPQEELNILITGARGFIGRNLAEYLSKTQTSSTLFCPNHDELELLDAEKVRKFVKGNNINTVIHCAGTGGSRKTKYDRERTDVVFNNLRMFFNLVHSLNSQGRMIFLGSGAEYDFRHYKPKMSEAYFGIHVPEDAYGFSKYVCSKYIENSSNIVNLRLFGVFGKYEDYECRFISNTILKNLLDLPIIINQNVKFDYLYVNDLARVIEYFIYHDANKKFYNVTTGETIDLVTIANKINQIAESPSQIIIKNPGFNMEYSAENTQLLETLNDFSFTPFDEALKELYSWYKRNLDEIDKRVIEKDKYLKYCRTKT